MSSNKRGRDGRSRDNNNPRLVPRRIMIFGTLPFFVYFCLHCNSHLGLHGIRNNPSLPTSVRGAIDRFYNVEIDGYRLVCKICKVACGFARGLHRVNLNTFGLMRVDPRHLISTCIAPYMSDNGEIIPHKHQCNMATEDHDISDPHDNVSLVSIRGDERLITMCPYALNFVGPATTMVVSSYNSTPFVTSLTTSAENNEPNDSGSQKKFKTETNEKTVTKGNGSVITVSDEESVNTVTNSEPVETEDQTKSVEKQNDSTIAVTENVLPVTEIVNVPAVTGLELLSTVATNNTELSVAEIVNDPAVALSEILPMDSRNENEPSVIDHGVVPTHTTVENVRNVLGDEASVTPLSRFSNIISSAFHNALNDQPSTSDSRFRPHSIVTAIRQATDVLETQPGPSINSFVNVQAPDNTHNSMSGSNCYYDTTTYSVTGYSINEFETINYGTNSSITNPTSTTETIVVDPIYADMVLNNLIARTLVPLERVNTTSYDHEFYGSLMLGLTEMNNATQQPLIYHDLQMLALRILATYTSEGLKDIFKLLLK